MAQGHIDIKVHNRLPREGIDPLDLPAVAYYTSMPYLCPRCRKYNFVASLNRREVVRCSCGRWLDLNLNAEKPLDWG